MRTSNILIIDNETANIEQKNPESIFHDIWTYSLFLYAHQFQSGTIGAQVNQASRFSQNGFQYQLVAYPKLIGPSYAYLSYAYSNSTLFPSHYYAGEFYIPLSKHIVASTGVSYYQILQTHLLLNTYSLECHLGAYSIMARSNYYIPQQGQQVVYWLFTIKRFFFDDPDNFLGLQVETGKTPDLADLSSVGFFIINANGVRLFTQFHLGHGVFLRLAIGTIKETFLIQTTRTKLFGGIGLKLRF